MARRLVTVFGGSGFIGRHLVQRLAAEGWVVRVAVRDPEAAAFLKTMGDVGQVVPIAADVTHERSVAAAVQGAQAVINLVGILYEKGGASFKAIHAEGAARVAAAAKAAGAEHFLHMSALGADKTSDSAYARTKAEGEEAVLRAFPGAVIFRPSVVFGPEDDFFNRFARMARISPFLPVFTKDGLKAHFKNGVFSLDLFGSGGPCFQPAYVGDVADAFVAALRSHQFDGKIFELGGPRRYRMKEIMELVMAETHRKRRLLPVPFGLGRLQAAFLQLLPKPPLTTDQVKQLGRDNIVEGGKPGFADLGITPTAAETILPSYLDRYREHEERTITRSRR